MKKRLPIMIFWTIILGTLLFIGAGCETQRDQSDPSVENSGVEEDLENQDSAENEEEEEPSYTVILDPGHGGEEKGRQAFGYDEKDLNNQLTEKIGKALEDRGITVEYTRHYSEDYYMSLSERKELANEMEADLFLSIHHDGSIHSEARGVSVFYSTYRPLISLKSAYLRNKITGDRYPLIEEIKNEEGRRDYVYIDDQGEKIQVDPNDEGLEPIEESPSSEALLSEKLAKDLAEALEETGLWSRGAIDDPYFVARRSIHPAVLIEAGFMTNAEELEGIIDPKTQQKRAEAIAEAVYSFLTEKYETSE